MKGTHLTKYFSATLSLAYFLSNCALAHSTETNFWRERRTAHNISRSTGDPQLASLPRVFQLPASTRVLPSALSEGSRISKKEISTSASLENILCRLPSHYGSVRSVQVPHNSDGRVAIYIQDVHLNTEAQKNIANTVSLLIKSRTPTLLALEGAFTPIGVQRFQTFPNQELIRKTANYLLKKNDITGPVHAAMTNGKTDLPIIGVDSSDHHHANVAAYRDSLANLNKIQKAHASEGAQLEERKKSAFNSQLLIFDRSVSSYHSGQLPLGSYLRLLRRSTDSLPPSVELFITALTSEENMDFRRVESERAQVLSALLQRLNPAETERLVNQSVAYRLGQLSNARFYNEIKALCARHDLNLLRFSALNDYIQYVLMSDGIDTERLFKDVQQMESQAYGVLTTSEEEKQLVKATRRHYLTGKLIDFSLTKHEWDEYKTTVHSPWTIDHGPELLSFQKFYSEAEARDDIMFQNLIRTPYFSPRSSVAILVTGGYHANGITERLLKSGVSVITFVPRLTKVETQSGVKALSVFAQEKTPLEKLFAGDKLYLGKYPASVEGASLFGAVIQRHMDPSADIKPVVQGLASDKGPAVSIKAEISGISDDRVTAEITRAGANGGTVQAEFDLNENHEIIFERELLVTRFAPELFAGALALWLHFGLGLPSSGIPLWAVEALIFPAVRLIWIIHLYIHGSGHVAGLKYFDKTLSASWTEAMEGLTGWKILLALVPFRSIKVSGISVGEKSNIRKKATTGILFSAVAAGLAGLPSLFFSISEADPALQFLYYAFIGTGMLFTLTAFSDVAAIYSGRATRFYCGNIFINAIRNSEDGKTLMPLRIRKLIGYMGIETAVRGRQAGGGLVLGNDKTKLTKFVGEKKVNAKRGDLTRRVLREIDTKVEVSEASGFRMLDTVTGFFHWRFGTSSPPSELETHFHEWVPVQDKMVWGFENSAGLEQKLKSVNIHIGHNGDFDGFEENDLFGAFGKKLDVGDVGEAMRVFLWPNETKGDSPKIAGVMNLLATQGMWDASARLAYLLQVTPTFKDAYREYFTPKKEWIQVEEDNVKVWKQRDVSVSQEVQGLTSRWGDLFEEVFATHHKKLFPSSAKKFGDINRKAIPAFMKEVLAKMDDEPSMDQWTQEQKVAFVESALFVFMNNNLENALKMFMTMPQKTSTFGLGVISTLEPESTLVAAKGQPLTIGYSPKGKFYATASEPAAVISTLRDDEGAGIFDLDDDGGEIARVNPKSGITVYSELHRRYLSVAELEQRWIPVHDNPYIHIPRMPKPGEDLIKDDLDDTAGVLAKLQSDFSDPNSWNSQTLRRLSANIIEKIKMNGHGKKPEEVDFILVAEEKSRQVAIRFANDLRAVFPTLKICVISGNRYLKNQSKLYKNGIIGSGTLMMAISQSGQTFPTLKATRHAAREAENITFNDLLASEKLENDHSPLDKVEISHALRDAIKKKDEGKLKDVFVMTGEWQSKMGKALGQEFKPDSPFGARIFCNQSMRRRAEASTVATVAADFTLTKILTHVVRDVRNKFSDMSPYKMTISKKSVERLELEAEQFVAQHVPNLTGPDSPVYKSIVSQGRRWADHTLEPLTALLIAIGIIVVTVSFGWAPFSLISQGMIYLVGFGLPAFFLSPLNAAFYASLFWTVPYGLRWMQARPILARTGTRSIVIASPMWKLLRNYVERLWGEGWGHLTPFVDGRKAEDLVNDKASSVVRGTLIFGQVDDSAPFVEGQQQEISATKMALSQADGIRNFGVGPEIKFMRFDSAKKSKFTSIDLRNAPVAADPTDSEIDPGTHELITSRFRNLELLIGGQVFFWAMADRTARFQLRLFHKSVDSRTQRVIEKIFLPINWVLSKSFVLLYSIVSRWIIGTEPTDRLFVTGATQSGTAIATTQTTPDRSSMGTEGTARDVRTLAKQIRKYSNLPRAEWVPQSVNSVIPYVLAHIYEPNHFYVASEVEGIEPEEPPFSLADKSDSQIFQIDPATKWHIYKEGNEKTLVIPAHDQAGVIDLIENSTKRDLRVKFNKRSLLRIANHGTSLLTSVNVPYNPVEKRHLLRTETGALEVVPVGEEGTLLTINGDYTFELVQEHPDRGPTLLQVNRVYLLNPPKEESILMETASTSIEESGIYPLVAAPSLPIKTLAFRMGVSIGFAALLLFIAMQVDFSSFLLFSILGTIVLPLTAITIVGRSATKIAMRPMNAVGQWFMQRPLGHIIYWGSFPMVKLAELFYEFGFSPLDRLYRRTVLGEAIKPDQTLLVGFLERSYAKTRSLPLQLALLPFFGLAIFLIKRVSLVLYSSVGQVTLTVAVLALGFSLSTVTGSVVGFHELPVWLPAALHTPVLQFFSPWLFANALILAATLLFVYRGSLVLRGIEVEKWNSLKFVRSVFWLGLMIQLLPLELALLKILLVQGLGIPWLFEVVDGQSGILGIGSRVLQALGIDPLQLLAAMAIAPTLSNQDKFKTGPDVDQEKFKLDLKKFNEDQQKREAVIENSRLNLATLTSQLDAQKAELEFRLMNEKTLTDEKNVAKGLVLTALNELNAAEELVRTQTMALTDIAREIKSTDVEAKIKTLKAELIKDPKFNSLLTEWQKWTLNPDVDESNRGHLRWREINMPSDPYTKALKGYGAAVELGKDSVYPRSGDFTPLTKEDLARVRPVGEFSDEELAAVGAKFTTADHSVVEVKFKQAKGNVAGVYLKADERTIIKDGELRRSPVGLEGMPDYDTARKELFADKIVRQSNVVEDMINDKAKLTKEQHVLTEKLKKSEAARLAAQEKWNAAENQEKQAHRKTVPSSDETRRAITELNNKIDQEKRNLEKEIKNRDSSKKPVEPDPVKKAESKPNENAKTPPAIWPAVTAGFSLVAGTIAAMLVSHSSRSQTKKERLADGLNEFLAGAALKLRIDQLDFRSSSVSERVAFMDRLHEELFSKPNNKKWTEDRARWLLEQVGMRQDGKDLEAVLPEGGAKPGSVLMVMLPHDNMPKNLPAYLGVLQRYNLRPSDQEPLGEVICVVDHPETFRLINGTKGLRAVFEPKLFVSDEPNSPARLSMGVVHRLLENDRNLKNKLRKTRLVTPMGVERDFTDVPTSSELRWMGVIYVNENLGVVELDGGIQRKINEWAVALVHA